MRDASHIEMLEDIVANAEIVDLSYTLENCMPAWPTQARYGTVVYESYDWGDAALHSQITLSEHTGTHIDAPKHFVPGAASVDELPISAVMGRGVVIDATRMPPMGLLSLGDLRDFEARNGDIRKGDIVMLRFGWDEKYGIKPEGADYLKDWPGLAEEGARYLAGKQVAAVGCDTLALDAFGLGANPCHHILLSKGIPILENIFNLSKLPVFSYVIGLPNKFKGGSGSPIRMVAFVRRDRA
ncbi:MAG: cyclase family protein [Synergistaceae bacterium]|jgi:kynurenine formamidase|nr:cyclase family protein [Synergistaceae bacterium]